jgi:hypothetical protein
MTRYAHPTLRARIREFLGTHADSGAESGAFLIVGDEGHIDYRTPRNAAELSRWLDQGCELYRSLWDSASLLVDLDIDYVNFDFPAEPFLDPGRSFALQEAVAATVEKRLLAFGIAPLHLLSGRGHHFLWRIGRQSGCFEWLKGLGQPPPSLLAHYERTPCPGGAHLDLALGRAYHGLGQVVEYLAAEVKRCSAPASRIPVELTAVEVGPGERGREMIALDVSEFGDPVDVRCVRMPYSRYLKPKRQRHSLGAELIERLPPIFEIPLFEMGVPDALKVMRDPQAVAELSERATALVPDASAGMERLMGAYAASALAQFHQRFYAVEPDPPDAWPQTYDRTDLGQLPPCARFILEHPNDALLRPSGMRRIVAALLALGWHPRHAAGLIQSKFEREFGWGRLWEGYDPATRADFYTRMFAGLIAARYDELVDFNCRSAQEQRTCHVPACQENLQPFKRSLSDRRILKRSENP